MLFKNFKLLNKTNLFCRAVPPCLQLFIKLINLTGNDFEGKYLLYLK